MERSRLKRGVGRGRWAGLWGAGVAWAGLACQSAGTPRPSESTAESQECPARLLSPEQSLTYTLTCEGFTPAAQRLVPGAKVTFVSACAQPVMLGFDNASTLFLSGRSSIVLKKEGEQTEETVGQTGGCHKACFGFDPCPPGDRDAKTGSLDVYTSGGPEPTPAPGR